MQRIVVSAVRGEGDLRPSGTYVVNNGGTNILTQHGPLPLPPGDSDVRYPALAASGAIAGQPQATVRGAWVWDPILRQWTTDPRIPASPNSLIYDDADVLHVNQLGPGYVGSQGFQYIAPDGSIVPGQTTYAAISNVAEWVDLSDAQDRSLLVGYAVWGYLCIVWDGAAGVNRLLEPGQAYRLRCRREGEQVAIAITQASQCVLLLTSRAELRTLPVTAPPDPTTPFVPAPTTPARAADGRLYDLGPFVLCDPALASRGGAGQQTNVQVDRPDGVILYGKFGTPGSYEAYALDADWFYSLEDASGPTQSQSWTDSRWFPRHQAIGEAAAFLTGVHQAIVKDRSTCVEQARTDFNRKMWLHALWDGFDWGPDLGVRATMLHVYDPTAGIHSPTRIIERRYDAAGAGWVRWEAYRSDLVYPNGPNGGAVFPESALVQRVDFYRLAPSPVLPVPTGCVPLVLPTPPPPPTLEGDLMQIFATVDPTKIIMAKATQPAAGFPGCLNYILEDGSVFSAHGDTRPISAAGPWEAGQPTGSGLVTFWADGVPHPYGVVLTGALPR